MAKADIAVANARLDLLCILSFVDGRLADSELDVIKDYLEKRYGIVQGIEAKIKHMKTLRGQQLVDKMHESARVLKDNQTKDELRAFMTTIIDLIFADGILHQNEIICFRKIEEIWELDIFKMLEGAV